MIKLQPASENDKAFFKALNKAVYINLVEEHLGGWDPVFQDQHFENKWAEHNFSFILLDDVQIGGIWVNDFEDYIRLREIQILPEYQNRGIGTGLINELIERAREDGKDLRLSVMKKNKARVLYRRMGFKVYDEDEMSLKMVLKTG